MARSRKTSARRQPTVKSPAKLAGTHRLLLDSLRFGRFHLRKLVPIVIVLTAVNILLQTAFSGETASLYQSLWFVFSSCGLIWTIRHLEDKATKVSLAQTYYTGTAPALRFFLLLVLVALVTIPFSIGGFIYGVLSPQATPIVQIVGGVVWLGLGLITLFLLARVVFALLIITLPEIRPLQAWRLSWQISRGRANAIVVRLLLPGLYLTLLMIGVVYVSSLLPVVAVAELAIEVVVSALVLPLIYIYLYKLYRSLT